MASLLGEPNKMKKLLKIELFKMTFLWTTLTTHAKRNRLGEIKVIP